MRVNTSKAQVVDAFNVIPDHFTGQMEQISDFVLQKEEHLKRRSGTSGWSCYGQLYTKDQFRAVSNGPSLEGKFQGMYVRGKNKLLKEI